MTKSCRGAAAEVGLLCLLWALPFGEGCSLAPGVEGYPAIRAACENELPMLPESDASLGDVSAGCSDAIGRAFALDWESFGDSPHAFSEATSPAEVIVGGLILLIGSGGSTVNEAMAAGPPPALEDRLWEHIGALALADDDDASSLWYSATSSRIEMIRYDPYIDAQMAYYADGTIRVGDVTNAIDDGAESDVIDVGGHMSIVEAAIVLFHESTHEFYPGHGSCATARQSCDPTPDGAYGAAAFWGGLWVSSHHSALPDSVCSVATGVVFDECAHVDDTTGYLPCGTSGELCYTD